MFILIFIICFALILFTGLYLMRSTQDYIDYRNKEYLKAINKVKPKVKKWNYYLL